MEFFLTWLVLASVQLAATVSPGPAFAMTVRNAVAHDRRVGLFASLGLGVGVAFQVALVIGGLATLMAQSALLFNIIKYAGAAYLIFIGVKALKAKKHVARTQDSAEIKPAKTPLSSLKAFQLGLWTNILNPKAVVFFTALFTQFVAPETPWQILTLYGGTSVFFEIAWFSFVTIVLTNAHIKARFMGVSHWIERVCGGLLMALGVRLALSKIH